MADLDALREALAAALDALDAPASGRRSDMQYATNAERQRAYRARKRNADSDSALQNRNATTEQIAGVTDDVTGPPLGGDPVTEVDPLHLAVTANGTRNVTDQSVTRNAIHDVTGPVKRCDRCGQPLADIRGQIICLECEHRDNYNPTVSDPEIAGYWHERLKDTARGMVVE